MNNKKTIVFVVNNLGYGGAQKMASFVAEACINLFDRVFLISLTSKETSILVNDKIAIKKLDYEDGKDILKKITSRIRTIRRLRKELFAIKPTMICVFGADALMLTKLAILRYKAKIISSERYSPYSYKWLWKIITKLLYASCDGMIFQTQKAMDFYSKNIGRKSVVIPNPYIKNTKEIKIFEGKRKKTVTAAAASFEYRKGLDILISAFSIVKKTHPDYKLIIYGQGMLLNEYMKQVKELNIEDSVVFPGITKDVSKAVYDSSVFVLPSRSEGMPNVLIEVLGVGVPTVSCDCPPGGPAFLTDNGRRGLLVKINDVTGMAKSICRILEDDSLSRELSKSGNEIIDLLSPSKVSALWIAFISQILEG